MLFFACLSDNKRFARRSLCRFAEIGGLTLALLVFLIPPTQAHGEEDMSPERMVGAWTCFLGVLGWLSFMFFRMTRRYHKKRAARSKRSIREILRGERRETPRPLRETPRFARRNSSWRRR